MVLTYDEGKACKHVSKDFTAWMGVKKDNWQNKRLICNVKHKGKAVDPDEGQLLGDGYEVVMSVGGVHAIAQCKDPHTLGYFETGSLALLARDDEEGFKTLMGSVIQRYKEMRDSNAVPTKESQGLLR
eukprot:52760-Eustigmatos_ZCMA.PRE.1